MGGEKAGHCTRRVLPVGSPPRGRGKVFLTDLVRVVVGITPAQAGKSQTCPARRSRCRDHPRVGGEKLSSGAYVAKDKGSPPRRRGKGVNVNCSADDIGITPAWAGKRSQVAAALQSGWDHPRTGGEKLFRLPLFQSPLGSPPHRRGKDFSVICALEEDRIPPAWAGKSICLALPITAPRDHPRVGGEKNALSSGLWPKSGSPPRRRGKGTGFVLDTGNVGITPAQAGKVRNERNEIMEVRITPAWAGKRQIRYR